MTFPKGDRVKHPNKPDWGIGQIFEVCADGKLRIYFVGGGRIYLDTRLIELIKVEGAEAQNQILDALNDPTWPYARYNIYVIEMNKCVLNERAFREENPNHVPSKECLYVGMTRHIPDERFQQHMEGGYLAARYVHRYKNGARLRYDLFQRFNPMHKRLAALMEIERAWQLRNQGYAVWQR